MSSIIRKIRIKNFKRFKDYTIEPNEKMNILIGDNEAGKSSILEAIDLVASGAVRRIESIGIDKLLNIDAVKNFVNLDNKSFESLPELRIELYLSGNFDFTMNGKNNSEGIECDGIKLVCEPNMDYLTEINAILSENQTYFPYDYYTVRFSTFMDEGYTGYKKKLRSVMIDSTNMNSEYAINDFVRRMYMQYTESEIKERANHKSNYRFMRADFQSNSLKDLNDRIPKDKNYSFGLKSVSAIGMETDLMIYENEIGIDSKGTGKQVFIKTDFALEHSGNNVDIVLIEEPENHLSHTNLRTLIQRVASTQNGQLFITTHNSLISTRLELNNLLIIHEGDANRPVKLNYLSEETAKYFMKAPPASIVEFALSNKTVLVEGPSEYMLLEKFYKSCTHKTPEEDAVHIIDVRGLSFKRYLEIAKLTGSKVAVITDNDGDAQKNCVEKYIDYSNESNIEIFYEKNNEKRTFEIVLFEDNKNLCENLFPSSPLPYMLVNKTEAAYTLLCQNQPIIVPEYIRRAIEWIKE